MERNFTQYIEQVKQCNAIFTKAVREKQDELNKVLIDWRYSPKGKQEQKEKFYKDLNASAANMTGVFKEAVKHFCDDFRVVLPDDGKDHAKDVENALRVIDMLQYDLDEKNLDNIMRPLRQSYLSMKTIVDVLEAKHKNAGIIPGAGYAPKLMLKLYDYMGISTRVAEYLNIFGNIEDILKGQESYRYEVTQYSNITTLEIFEVIPYSFLACGEWMEKAGKLYGELETEFNALFTNHVPTDAEVIESILKNQ